MHWLFDSLYHAAAMLWEMLWALVLGFSLSAALQIFVSREKMAQWFGHPGWREIGLATALGAASSSCSYAATATAHTAFKKGAAFAPAIAFMFASTNLVLELGLVLWMLMGWRFVLAEAVGALVLIGLMWLLMALTLPSKLVEAARRLGSENKAGDCCHHHHHEPAAHTSSTSSRLARAYFMEWSMLWQEILIGVLIAGFLMVLVPPTWWKTLFVTSGSAPLRLVENALVGPLIAVASFVCSVGNIPLASLLWSSGIGFGGVIAFIYGDLIVLPLIFAYRKYYGWKLTAYLVTIMFLCMVASGILIDLLFRLLHLVPSSPPPGGALAHAHFSWNYTTWLDFAALAFSAWLFFQRGKETAPRPPPPH